MSFYCRASFHVKKLLDHCVMVKNQTFVMVVKTCAQPSICTLQKHWPVCISHWNGGDMKSCFHFCSQRKTTSNSSFMLQL